MDTAIDTQRDSDHDTPQTANAIVNAARQGRMGIESVAGRTVMNMTAVAIMCGGACWLTYVMIQQGKDDREMFRDELKALRMDAQDRYNRTEATHTKSMEKMGTTIERAVTAMEKATRALERVVEKQDCP